MGGSAAVLLLLTVPFWVWPLDLAIQEEAWQGESGWSLGEAQPWKFIYHFGTLPALLVAVGALFGLVLVLGTRWRKHVRWSQAAAYLALCMAIGPGLLVNLGLKDHWGRPRPRDVTAFGGEYPAEMVWIADPASPGKSFPCGHCTMGFYFFAPALLLWRLGRRRASAGVFGFALVSGGLLGVARILQGGHFASDVLWGGGICWLVALGLFYLLRLDETWTWEPSVPAWARRGPLQVAVGAATVGLVGAVLVATPYRREDRHGFAIPAGSPLELSLVLEGSRHHLWVQASAEEPGSILATGRGHGIPGSGVKSTWTERREADGRAYVQFKQRISGWFSELDQRNEIAVPAVAGEVRLRVRSGQAKVEWGRSMVRQEWRIEVEPGAKCQWTAGEGQGGEVLPGNPLEIRVPEAR